MANRIQPITPGEVGRQRTQDLPDEVFEVFNSLIAQNFDGGSAKVMQEDAVDALVDKGFTEEEIFEKDLLDVELAYRAAGWKVEYDKPGYNETYDAFFTFRARRSR